MASAPDPSVPKWEKACACNKTGTAEQGSRRLVKSCFFQGGTDHVKRLPSLGSRRTRDSLFSSVQSLSRVRLFATPWTAARQASLSITNSRNLLKLMSFESVMPSNHLILCCPLLLLLSVFPSIRVFSKWVGSSHRVAKLLELQLRHQSFQ